MRKRVLPLIVALFFAIPVILSAQTWEPLGPYGISTLYQVAESDSALVMLCDVGSATELFRSEDNGISWERTDFPYNKMKERLSAIACLDNVFYAATFHSDVCMSTDHGRTWIVRNDIHDGQFSFAVGSMLDINNSLYVGWGDKYYNSNDSGLTYFFEKARVDGDMIKSFIIKDNLIDNIVTVTKNGVYLSNDRAGSWKTITPEFVEDDYDGRDLAVLGNTIYVSTYRRVYYSSDLGATWKVSTPFTLGATYIRIASYASRLWIASDSSLFSTSNNFTSVEQAVMPPTYRFTWSLVPTTKGLFISTYEGGAYVTFDSAKTWIFLEEGFPLRVVSNVWANDDVLLGGTATGLLMRSTNNGNSWERSFQSSTISSGSNQFSATFQIGDTIVTTIDEDHLVLRSGDDGITWVTNDKPAPWNEIHDIAGNNNVWVAVIKRDGSVVRSSDRGGSWSLVKGGYANDNFRMITLFDTSFFAASPRDGIWRSNADATKFEKLVGVGLPEGTCYSVASNDRVIFVGSHAGLYRSLDSGTSWQKIDFPFTSQVYDIKCYGANVVILERTSVSNMLYFSPNNCDTIITLSEGGFTSRETAEVDINSSYLFAQTRDKGIFRYNYLPLKFIYTPRPRITFSLSPNPASERVILYSEEDLEEVSLINTLGVTLRTYDVKASIRNELTIDVSSIPNGMYLVKVKSGEAVETMPIIITHE